MAWVSRVCRQGYSPPLFVFVPVHLLQWWKVEVMLSDLHIQAISAARVVKQMASAIVES